MNLYGPSERARCGCRCHAVVVLGDLEELKAVLHAPPRLDASLAWAEACQRCSFNHWIAASVHDQVTALEADEKENLAVYYITHPRTNGNADC